MRFSNMALFGFSLVVVLLLAAPPVDSKESDIVAELVEFMTGKFESTGSADASADDGLTDWRQSVPNSTLGKHVVYLQLNSGPDRALYRQRILLFQLLDDKQSIEQRAYEIKDAAAFEDANPEQLEKLTASDINRLLSDGCEQIWQRTEDGYKGYVDPASCRIISGRTGKPRRIEAESIITRSTLKVTERGYDDDFNQLFGTAPGEFIELARLTDTE